MIGSLDADRLISSVCEDDDEVIASFARWLREKPLPDDWHRFVLGANWDFVPPELFQWIALQGVCDRATALLLFWKSQPEFDLDYPDSDREDRVLIELLRERWLKGAYCRSELAFERESDAWTIDFEKLESEHGERVEQELPSSMRPDLPGRKVSIDDCIDGIPKRFWPEDCW